MSLPKWSSWGWGIECWGRSCLVGLLLWGNHAALAADLPELKARTNRVIIFKDGYALVHRSGTGKTNEQGLIATDAVPNSAVLGTLWMHANQGRIKGVQARWVTKDSEEQREVLCERVDQVLAANVGRRAKLKLQDDSVVDGTLVQVLQGKPQPEPDTAALSAAADATLSFRSTAPGAESADSSTRSTATVIRPGAASFFVIETADGRTLLSVSQVKALQITDMQLKTTERVKRQDTTKQLAVQHDQNSADVELNWIYFRPGFRWVPTYRLQLPADPNQHQVRIEMQAELLNEGEDITDADIDIVVGVPHFQFKDVPSPLILEQALQATLSQVAPVLMNNFRALSNNSVQVSDYGLRSQEFRADSAAAGGALEAGAVNLSDDLTAEGAQELFVYNLGRRTLAKGERMLAPIFQTSAKFTDLYTWDINLLQQQQPEAQPSGSSPLQLSTNRVWRQLVLTNETKLPWTTGPVLLMQDNRPLAQDLMTYTAPRNDVRVPVTVAVDINASYVDEELERIANAVQAAGYSYAQLKKRLKLDVCNNKNRPVPLEVKLTVLGQATQVSLDGRARQEPLRRDAAGGYDPAWAVNSQTTIVWKRELQPGETFTPEVEYSHYVRH